MKVLFVIGMVMFILLSMFHAGRVMERNRTIDFFQQVVKDDKATIKLGPKIFITMKYIETDDRYLVWITEGE